MKEISSLIDKILLAGITILDSEDQLICQFQVFGPIVKIDASGITINRSFSGIEFALPPDFESIQEANPGEYRLRSSGETVLNPDYLSSWTVKGAKRESIEEYQSHGFRGYERLL